MSDMTPGQETAEARAAHEWAEQQRAAARASFSTPSWLGERSSGHVVPPQPTGDYEETIPEQRIPPPPAVSIVSDATWVEKRGSRSVSGTFLVAAVAATAYFAYEAVTARTTVMMIALALSAFVTIVIRLGMMSSQLTTVVLKGSQLTVSRGGLHDSFVLTDPMHMIDLVGSPTDASWRARLETVDGRVVELRPNQVDAPALHEAIRYYQNIADQVRRDRENRFRQ